jgi:hypothetical protein
LQEQEGEVKKDKKNANEKIEYRKIRSCKGGDYFLSNIMMAAFVAVCVDPNSTTPGARMRCWSSYTASAIANMG